MLGLPDSTEDERVGQATFEMANLRPDRTGLSFVVFISQKAGAQHDVRVKVSPGPRVQLSQMGTYAIRPFRHEGGWRLAADEERRLELWIDRNRQVLVAYWDGDIVYTEDALDRIVSV